MALQFRFTSSSSPGNAVEATGFRFGDLLLCSSPVRSITASPILVVSNANTTVTLNRASTRFLPLVANMTDWDEDDQVSLLAMQLDSDELEKFGSILHDYAFHTQFTRAPMGSWVNVEMDSSDVVVCEVVFEEVGGNQNDFRYYWIALRDPHSVGRPVFSPAAGQLVGIVTRVDPLLGLAIVTADLHSLVRRRNNRRPKQVAREEQRSALQAFRNLQRYPPPESRFFADL